MKSSRTIDNLELDEQSIKQAVFNDRVAQFMARERNVSISGPLASGYLAFIHYGVIELNILLMWWVALVVCDSATFISTNIYLRQLNTSNARNWLMGVVGSQTCAGIVWGLSVLIFKVPTALQYEFYTLVILVAVSSVTSVALLPFRTAFVGFLVGIWTFPLIHFLYLGELFYLNLSIGIVLMVATLVSYQVISTRQFVDGIEQKLRATMLASQLDDALKKLEKLAIYDELTGVYNRSFGLDCLRKEKRIQQRLGHPLSVVILDVDLFKSINDRYGHLVGDEVLVRFAKCVQTSLREGGTLCRYGGEEFLLVMPRTSSDEALVVTERIRTAINSAPQVIEPVELNISASFGVAETSADEDIDSAIDRADRALYEAKRKGRDRIELAASLDVV